MEKNQLKQYLFSLLAKREYSEWELRNKLAYKTNNESLIDELLQEFKSNGWQSDQRFIEALIDCKKNKYGLLKIKQDAASKGISTANLEDSLPDATEQLLVAVKLLHKKYKVPDNTLSSKQKYFRFLHSKGFTTDIVYQAIGEFTLSIHPL